MKKPLFNFSDSGDVFDCETGERVGYINLYGVFTPEKGMYANPIAVANSARIIVENNVLRSQKFINCALSSNIKLPETKIIRECCSNHKDPVGLRWKQIEYDIPIRWCLDYPDSFQLSKDLVRNILYEVLWEIYQHCYILFVEDEDCQIRIGFGNIDNKWGTLGQTWLPTRGTEIGVCELCGDIMIDSSEDWENEDNFYNVLLHEMLHALGLGHAKQGTSNVMAPMYYWDSPRGRLGDWDYHELNKRYPFWRI